MAFGKIIDMACLVQQTSCTRKGACIFYDNDKFRIYHHTFAAVVKFAAFLGYLGACIFASRAASKKKTEQSENNTELRHKNIPTMNNEEKQGFLEEDEAQSQF